MTESSTLSILIGSFDTCKRYPPNDIELSSWLIDPKITPHIIAVGLQELPLSLLSFQQRSECKWTKILERTLPNHKLLSRVRLNGKTSHCFCFA